MKKYEKINDSLILKAKKTNLVNYLRTKHPESISYTNHPDAEKYYCWRSQTHDSLVFFSDTDTDGNTVHKYHRWSTKEQDDGIQYLVKYEGYSWPSAVKSLAYFVDPIDD